MSEVLQIVLDTNVIIAGLRSKRGASFRLLQLVGTNTRFQINLSVALAFEYEDVIKRQSAELQLTLDDANDLIDYFCSVANLRQIHFLFRPSLPDPRDEFVLELAVECKADYLVTFNTKYLNVAQVYGIEVIKPNDFLLVIGEPL